MTRRSRLRPRCQPHPRVRLRCLGPRMPLAVRFAEILADTGVTHGLIGPREVPRLWDRHLLNCAVVHDAFPVAAKLVDVGSGAGLPGVALAIVRPDLDVHLVEPMLRRTAVALGRGRGARARQRDGSSGRAEDLVGVVAAPFVTARAVARLDKLARWCVPLLEPGGTPGGDEGALGRRGAGGRSPCARPARPDRRGGHRARGRRARGAGAHRRPPLRASTPAKGGSPGEVGQLRQRCSCVNSGQSGQGGDGWWRAQRWARQAVARGRRRA